MLVKGEVFPMGKGFMTDREFRKLIKQLRQNRKTIRVEPGSTTPRKDFTLPECVCQNDHPPWEECNGSTGLEGR